MNGTTLLQLTADIVAAHVGANAVAASELPHAIALVHGALAALREPAPPVAEPVQPAVSIKSSVKADSITCLDCGAKQKMLKRHLHTSHGLTPAAYRAKWSLPDSYPLVAPEYAALRGELAKKIGLGRKPGMKMKPRETPGQR